MSEKTSAATEQRRYPRSPVNVTLDFRLPGQNGARCRGTITDLSQGGMAFRTDALLEEGMTLHLKLPSSIQIRGEVRYAGALNAGQRRYGIRFHKIGYPPII